MQRHSNPLNEVRASRADMFPYAMRDLTGLIGRARAGANAGYVCDFISARVDQDAAVAGADAVRLRGHQLLMSMSLLSATVFRPAQMLTGASTVGLKVKSPASMSHALEGRLHLRRAVVDAASGWFVNDRGADLEAVVVPRHQRLAVVL